MRDLPPEPAPQTSYSQHTFTYSRMINNSCGIVLWFFVAFFQGLAAGREGCHDEIEMVRQSWPSVSGTPLPKVYTISKK